MAAIRFASVLIAFNAIGVIKVPTAGIAIDATVTVPPLAGNTLPLHTLNAS